MDSRTAAHALNQIARYLELHGEGRFKVRAYQQAARAVQALDSDDLGAPLRSGELEKVPGLGPASISVIRDLAETGDSSLLDRLRESTPEGLLEMLRVPGLGPAKIHLIHTELDVDSLQQLEDAARDGRLATVKGFGPKTAEKVLKGIAFMRKSDALVLYPHAAAEAARLLAAVRSHPDVVRAEVAGSIRRRREVIRSVSIVAACRDAAATRVASSFAHAPGVSEVMGGGGRAVQIRYVDGTLLDLRCVAEPELAVALWRATGDGTHAGAVVARLAQRGLTLDGDTLRGADGAAVAVPDEATLYARAGLAYVPPEMREGCGEVEAAATHTLPHLIEFDDVRGVLHAHSEFSDGESTIREMAEAARARGWSYLGVTDHSQSAFYAGGLSRDAVQRQHEEIDRLNTELDGFRVLKGIEADILPCGRVDYDGQTLDQFDYVIGSIHSRFGMNEAQMTDRVLKAMDDPHMTVLGHPTGRLLLTREPYAIDMHAVLEAAAERGVAVELNADPHRLDLDWRLCQTARRLGVTIEIGPDAHSVNGLDNMRLGIDIARKGWLGAGDVLNARPADEVLEFARKRRQQG
ncbi:MAG TPA: DNA polymerase/3'-5' exonuclease PolX [Gemmatimonadales bacterium]